MIDWIQIYGISGLIFAFVFPYIFHKKGKTWFRGWGQCEMFGAYICHAKPRPEFRCNHNGEVSWYCDSHYQETLAIGMMVDKVCNKEISNEQFWAWRKTTR